MKLQLQIDPDRLRLRLHETGINVRAADAHGNVGNADIIHLDGPSLLEWLRSRGGRNTLAENTVGSLLGHDRLTDE